MTDALLLELATIGVEVAAVGDMLRVDAPPGILTPALLERLADQKQRLMSILSEGTTADDNPVDLKLTDLDRRVVTAIRAGETIKFTTHPEVPDGAIPDGWTRSGWITRLRQLADTCASIRPDLAVKHRAEADRLDQTSKSIHGGTTHDDK